MKSGIIGCVGAGTLALLGCAGNGQRAPKPKAVILVPGAGVVIAPTVTLSGKLSDRATSLPLASATVLAQAADRPLVFASTQTRADGTFTLTGLPQGLAVRVVSQPVTGAVAYDVEVSDPITLVRGATPPAVNLSFTQVPATGRVEGQRPPRPGRAFRGLYLTRRSPVGGGRTLQVVVRTLGAGHSSFRFEALPPGDYELLFPVHGRARGPVPVRNGRPVPEGLARRSVPVTVRAGEASHLDLGTHGLADRDGAEAAEMAEDEQV